MSTDAKTMLETIGASMRKQLEGAHLEPLHLPVYIQKEDDIEFGKLCIQAVLEAGLQIRTQEGEWVVMTPKSSGF